MFFFWRYFLRDNSYNSKLKKKYNENITSLEDNIKKLAMFLLINCANKKYMNPLVLRWVNSFGPLLLPHIDDSIYYHGLKWFLDKDKSHYQLKDKIFFLLNFMPICPMI